MHCLRICLYVSCPAKSQLNRTANVSSGFGSQLNRTTNVSGVESQLNCTANVSDGVESQLNRSVHGLSVSAYPFVPCLPETTCFSTCFSTCTWHSFTN